MSVYVYMYVWMYVCMQVFCMYVCKYECMYVCKYVCMYVLQKVLQNAQSQKIIEILPNKPRSCSIWLNSHTSTWATFCLTLVVIFLPVLKLLYPNATTCPLAPQIPLYKVFPDCSGICDPPRLEFRLHPVLYVICLCCSLPQSCLLSCPVSLSPIFLVLSSLMTPAVRPH